MAAREFTVSLLNNTPSQLKFKGEWLDHGIWSDGGFPPDTIDPGKTGTWHSESSGVATGVQGHVTYQVLDKDHFFGTFPDNHMGLQGCFTVNFDNPYIGAPSFPYPAVGPCADLLESGDPSGDYQFFLQVSQGGDEKWTEWLTALAIGPLDFLHTSHPMVMAMIQVKPVPPGPKASDSGLKNVPPTPALVTRPVSGSPPQTWIGGWIDNVSAPKFRCSVAFTAPTPRGVPAPGRFDIDFHDSVSGVDIHNPAGNVVNEPATEFKGDIIPPPAGPPVSIGTPLPGRAGGPSTDLGGIGRASTGPAKTVVVGPTVNADTVHLDPQNLLQLFGDFKPSGELVQNRLRCMRVLPDGKRVLDIMLLKGGAIR